MHAKPVRPMKSLRMSTALSWPWCSNNERAKGKTQERSSFLIAQVGPSSIAVFRLPWFYRLANEKPPKEHDPVLAKEQKERQTTKQFTDPIWSLKYCNVPFPRFSSSAIDRSVAKKQTNNQTNKTNEMI